MASQINPTAGAGTSYLGQEVAIRSINQCKIPSQELCSFSKDSSLHRNGVIRAPHLWGAFGELLEGSLGTARLGDHSYSKHAA